MKFLENALARLRWYADARILYRNRKPPQVPTARRYRDGSFFREFNCVAEEVDENLKQPALVGKQRRQICLDFFHQPKLFRLDHRLDRAKTRIDQRLQGESCWMWLNASRFDF